MKKVNWKLINEKASNWILNYANKNGINSLVIGISGGIDSAVVSYLCAMTGLKVYVISMPILQPEASLNRAKNHIKWLMERFPNVEEHHVDLTEPFIMFDAHLAKTFGINNELCSANLRSRMRMNTLYYKAGDVSGLVVGTGNKVEDFGVGFFTKYGDGGVDISPIAGLMKSEVYLMAEAADINEEIRIAVPTDDLRVNGASDEQQIGATYPELEFAMNMQNVYQPKLTKRGEEVMLIFQNFNTKNKHKMEPIPVFDADAAIIEQVGYRPKNTDVITQDSELGNLVKFRKPASA